MATVQIHEDIRGLGGIFLLLADCIATLVGLLVGCVILFLAGGVLNRIW